MIMYGNNYERETRKQRNETKIDFKESYIFKK